mgnify:CR=1 FL=1
MKIEALPTRKSKLIGSKSAKSGGRTDKHNKKVKEGNVNFSRRLLEKAKEDKYESSEASSENEIDISPAKGELITLNLDLGGRGIFILHGLNT